MADIGKLAMVLSVNPGTFYKDLDTMNQRVQGLGKTVASIGSGSFSFTSALGAISPQLGAVTGAFTGLGASMMAAGEKGIHFIGDVGAIARRFQMSTTDATALAIASQRLGVDSAAAGLSIQHMNLELGKATQGSPEAQAAFARLGLRFDELTKIPAKEALAQIGDRLNAVGSIAERTAIAQTIFGKSFAEIDGLLRGGSQAMREAEQATKQFGLAVSETDTKNLKEMKRSTRDMGLATEGLSLTIGKALLPAITAFNDAIVHALVVLKPLFDLLGGVISLLSKGTAWILGAIGLGRYRAEVSMTNQELTRLRELQSQPAAAAPKNPAEEPLLARIKAMQDEIKENQGPLGPKGQIGSNRIAALEQEIERTRALLPITQRLVEEQRAAEAAFYAAAAAADQVAREQDFFAQRATEATNAINEQALAMQEQADQFGMTARQAQIYRAELAGASEEALNFARSEDARLSALEDRKKLEQQIMAEVNRGGTQQVHGAAALEFGSSAAVSAVNKAVINAQVGAQDPQKKVEDAVNKVRDANERQIILQRRIAEALENVREEEIPI